MPLSHFAFENKVYLAISALLLIASIISFKFRRHQYLTLGLLFAGTFALGFFMASLDPFLYLWDEQFHALVAKNMVDNPLKPMLYENPVIGYDHTNWTFNNVWLHKQPLFLWQIALSIKIFGLNEIAVRLPSILLHALIPILIYRIGDLIRNKETGFYAALLFATLYFPLELVVGRYATDHNDISFLFYVTASFWAWFEYEKSQKRYWLILIGLFSGCAVLVKWLMGLLVFVTWTFTKFFSEPATRFKIKSYLPLVYSGLICLLIFLPWQIYILTKYPIEAAYEYQLNGKHFFEVIEGHAEHLWYYFNDGLKFIYGSGALVPYSLLLGFVLLLVKLPQRKHKIAIGFVVLFIYAFFTLAKTKMNGFPLIVSPFLLLGLGLLFDVIISFLERNIKKRVIPAILSVLLLSFTAYQALNLNKIQMRHTMWMPWENNERASFLAQKKFALSLEKQLNYDDDYVIFNTNIVIFGHVQIMFYTDYTAYDFIPNEVQIAEVKKAGMKVAILNPGDLPDYIRNDSDIVLLDRE